MKLKEIEKIVIKTRKQFRNNEINEILLIDLYQKYNPHVGDIHVYVNKSKEIFPYLNCGLTTVYLQHILQRGKIIQGKYNSNDHTFLLLPRNIVIDITADQFGGPECYVGRLREPWTVD